MVLRIIPQMARSTHGHQILILAVFRLMVLVRNRERSLVCVKWFSWFSALLAALFAFPSGALLFCKGDGFPVFGVEIPLHRHFSSPFQPVPCVGSLSVAVVVLFLPACLSVGALRGGGTPAGVPPPRAQPTPLPPGVSHLFVDAPFFTTTFEPFKRRFSLSHLYGRNSDFPLIHQCHQSRF